ncbi:hypothetical protein JAAARDRAFT_299938 [Jaapia argillacea MUCL 33604]|uniref:HIG1 domain-containing protein n=1 Tax=Jaapia argillacea MUCL 33604 TaxID=933084 RepID=A0A067PZN9_9AGAM|nr:hypothetical protein JAAARDRAFT_299938 [Jaapia argillacea MUCL 33604]
MSVTELKAPRPGETFGEKAKRKFKEEPLVPIFTAATTFAMVMAMVKLRSRESRSFNNWLRVRIISQGLAIASIVGGSYYYGQTKSQLEAKAALEQERFLAKAAQERAEFEERLRGAEEAHNEEQKARGIFGMLGAGGKGGLGKKPAEVISAGDAHKAERVAKVEELSTSGEKKQGWWEWMGWKSSSPTNSEKNS